MMQWGWVGQEIDTDAWWTTNRHIPAVHVVPAGRVEVVEILEERRPKTDVYNIDRRLQHWASGRNAVTA